jgi:hypothetical protein
VAVRAAQQVGAADVESGASVVRRIRPVSKLPPARLAAHQYVPRGAEGVPAKDRYENP